ncbi:Glutathione S-transferase, partial [Araneus ventricosus]
MAKPILGYWDIRGTAEPIRYLLHYERIDFEDKRYPSNDSGYDEWQKDKLNLGLDFPSLPYYIKGDIKMTNSIAIMRYVGLTRGLTGTIHEEKRRRVIVEQQSVAFHDKLRNFVVSKEYETTGKERFLKSVRPMFQQWEKFIGVRRFMVGDDINFVDFLVYEALDHYRLYHETILDDYPSLRAYFSRMKNLPELQEYL